MTELQVVRAGTVDYEQAWARQRELHAARVAGTGPDTMLLLEHPSVYTAGRRTLDHEKPKDGTPVVIINRGATRGDDLATLHVDAGCSDVLTTLATALR